MGIILTVIGLLWGVYSFTKMYDLNSVNSSPRPSVIDPGIPGNAQAQLAAPNEITPGDDVTINGSTTGLNGRAVWIIDQPADSRNGLVIASDGPAATSDGPWTIRDREVGDDSDYGSAMTFLAVQADQQCSALLQSVVDAAGDDNEAKITTLPTGCTEIARVAVPFSE